MFHFLKLSCLERYIRTNHARSHVLLGVLLLSALVVATQILPYSFGVPSASAAPIPSAPTSIAPWSDSSARVRFVGDEVQLTLHGTTQIVAHDDSKRLDPVYIPLALVAPDDSALLYVTALHRGWDHVAVNVVNLTTLQKQVIATFPNRFWPQLRWSPDSQHIAYVLSNAKTGEPEIYVMDANGTHARQVIAGNTLTRKSLSGYEQDMFGWTSDGSALLYYDNALTPQTAYVVSLSTGQLSTQPVNTSSVISSSLPSTPCNAPILMQTDSRWSGNIMQTAGQTIGADGCALTSVTMMADYYGASQDPSTMNSCLGNYADPLYWGPVATNCSQNTMAFDSSTGWSWSTLNSALNAGHPTPLGIVWSNGGTHWVLVVSGDGSNNPANYEINDPEYAARRTLYDLFVTEGATPTDLRLYHPTAGSNWPPCITGSSGSQAPHNDFNGDGLSDALAFYDYGTDSSGNHSMGAQEWLSNPGTTSLTYRYSQQVWPPTSGYTWSHAKWISGDFNGDGKTDAMAFYDLGSPAPYNVPATEALLWTSTGSGLSNPIQVWTSLGHGGFDWSKATWIGGDFNGDGKADAMAFYNTGTNSTAAYTWLSPSTGSSLVYKGQVWSSTGYTWSNAKWISGDFNGDGLSDAMAFYNYGSATTGAQEWLSNPGTTSLTYRYDTQVWPQTTGYDWTKAKWISGDFNGDGLSDAMAFYDYGNSSTGAQEWLSNPGTSLLTYHGSQGVWPQTSGYTWSNATWVSGDFNGDGRSDAMAFYNYGTNGTGAQEWLSNPGTTLLTYHGVQEVWGPITGYTWTNAAWLP